ncbi:hypothetical protein XI08_38320 [Bradyrhizobium sp. CCBAU 11361]|nr:hypothetical protein [Bradyrhizobium sp. CCBAU 11361]
MISAEKGFPIEHQPLIVGRACDPSSLSLFGIISEHHLRQFQIERVADVVDVAVDSNNCCEKMWLSIFNARGYVPHKSSREETT